MERNYFYGTGRRKTSVARVRLIPGGSEFVVNGKAVAEYFPRVAHQVAAVEPLKTVTTEGTFGVMVKVLGGGVTGQADAIAHGLARALVQANEENRKALRLAGLLTRDPRVKESKKYGLKRARKAPQYTKR